MTKSRCQPWRLVSARYRDALASRYRGALAMERSNQSECNDRDPNELENLKILEFVIKKERQNLMFRKI